MTHDALSELTVPGTLRVGINLGNILLVTGTGPHRRSGRCRAGHGGGGR